MTPTLSVVVAAYNMERELPRTIRSLSPAMQAGVTADDYEIIVVDNGSTNPLDGSRCPTFGAQVTWLRTRDPNASPARGINQALAVARGEHVGVFIDGARMASPGLLSAALASLKMHARPIVAAAGFHLGTELQTISIKKGYNQQVEDELLRKVAWEADGYRLFEIATFAGSSSGGWFAPMAESNGMFMPRATWTALGGYDEAFLQPGGGLVNLDLYKRACDLPGARLIVLLGEGTFHQVHGGVAANAAVSPWDQFHDEYLRLRGVPFSPPRNEPMFVGHVRRQTLKFLAQSILSDQAARW